jgi:hypothetical protein
VPGGAEAPRYGAVVVSAPIMETEVEPPDIVPTAAPYIVLPEVGLVPPDPGPFIILPGVVVLGSLHPTTASASNTTSTASASVAMRLLFFISPPFAPPQRATLDKTFH